MTNALAKKMMFFKHVVMPSDVILCIGEEKSAVARICFGEIEMQ